MKKVDANNGCISWWIAAGAITIAVKASKEAHIKVAEIVRDNSSQLVRLPEEFHLEGDAVFIRRRGQAIILEPVKPATWPPAFFDQIHIQDPAFARPAQGSVPPAPTLD